MQETRQLGTVPNAPITIGMVSVLTLKKERNFSAIGEYFSFFSSSLALTFPSQVNIVLFFCIMRVHTKNQYPLIFHSSDKPFIKRYITRIKLKATANSSSKIYILQIQKQKKLQKYKITSFSKMQYISI